MNNLDDMLHYDALNEAEKITGKSYKEDPLTESLGFLMLIDHAQKKREALEKADDTTLSNSLDNYQRIINDIGFEVVLSLPFSSRWNPDIPETEFYYFNRQYGILLHFDTFGGTSVNSGKYYYNWRTNSGSWIMKEHEGYNGKTYKSPVLLNDYPYNVTSSGSWNLAEKDKDAPVDSVVDMVWAGDHDCREAIRHNIRNLLEHGEFVSPWTVAPYITFNNYTEFHNAPESFGKESDAYFGKIMKSKYAQLPDFVKETIGVYANSRYYNK